MVVPLVVLLTLAASVNGLGRQSGSVASTAATAPVDRSWPEVDLNVLVLASHGAPQKIEEREFELLQDGTKHPLDVGSSPDSPVSLALVIDSSGSIFKRKDEIAAAVKTIVKALPDGSEVMAVLFADLAFLDVPFTPCSKVDFSFLEHLDGRGGTALFDAVVATENYVAAKARYPRRALVVISDGGDNGSTLSLAQAIVRMQWPGAPMLYAVHVHNSGLKYGGAYRGKRIMELLAEATGGIAFTTKEKDIQSAVEGITGMIRDQYVLHFTAADPARDRRASKLEVRLPNKDLQIHAQPTYFAPSK